MYKDECEKIQIGYSIKMLIIVKITASFTNIIRN